MPKGKRYRTCRYKKLLETHFSFAHQTLHAIYIAKRALVTYKTNIRYTKRMPKPN